ncbi:cytochrome b/b6 domain-containing protein [Plesiomonas shigelloides]|uniref:cytochrome b/b6 domain-containing protein n=1 Tax=Plesiomonas shigelloides TaxID=703 RepID=UPI001C5A7884|nr:cytochrome b/b6 domain-containing protein [Plesiomonas shigelloides]MBW3792243.1 cytochrome b/b6 domain-containing protein [Plesiomonas shigelloides]
MRLFSDFWRYLGQYQHRFVRVLHLTLAALVILQILNSNGMQFTAEGAISAGIVAPLFVWMHIGMGCTALVLGLLLTLHCLFSRGLRYFFPYLWGDFSQLKVDLRTLWQRRLPESAAGGLAPCIQGLGLGAILLVAGSGFTWFLLWRTGSVWAPDLKSVHKALTGLIEAYLVGHGGMALLHFFFWRRNQAKTGSSVV